ncbi:DNA polymerase III subunit alpha [Succinatimonas hippei]|uniref:DNA polymerase III subunit alpha n=1 Tax=Succinatimonas hippei TaxID=626938 RepID=UPI00255C891D|nr:DNA polymerase III subunit alpha [Succinatimonas hippei]
MPNITYIPLHVHSDYSIMDGLESVGAIVKRAAALKIPALAITDISNICGFIKFYTACKSAGIKPIMGADIEVEEEVKPGEKATSFKLTLLAMDRVGQQNLYDILSDAWLRSDAGAFNAKTSLADLKKYSEGIIILDGFRGDIAAMAQRKDSKAIRARLKFYLENFNDRFCFEITRTNRIGESEFENFALNLCVEYNIAPVATNDTVFLFGEDNVGKDGFSDYQIHDVRVSIQAGCQRGNKEMARKYSKEQYLKTPEQMEALFADIPEALQNTRNIAERCNIEIELDHPRLPRYPTGDLSPAEYLRKKAAEGLEERLEFLYPDEKERNEKRQTYVDRLNTELDVIINMDFPGYFLIVMEFIQWSKEHGVPVGPGRGSGGGSLVAYSLKITDFDPLRFDLLFERFLNPERISMPDFDVDFCQRNREKTLEHVKNRYGNNAVSQIATFGTMAPKAAIKDAGRALGMGYGAVDFVAKQLPTQPGLTFKAAMGIGKDGKPCDPLAPDFVNLYQKALQDDDRQRVELIHIALRLEGVIRNIGKHAAGVVISPTRTAEFSPLMLDSDGNSITQFDKKDVEHAGLVKFDFLGLTTLTIIDDALTMINARKAKHHEPPVNIHAVPYEDPESFAVLQQCETTAVFQLESAGMRKLIGQMQPDRFDDLIALVALYRPGPIKSGMVDHFVQRKHGKEEVAYPSPDFQDLDLKPILDSTYGVIVYQEQVMQIAQVLAGYSLGGADILRRAMGKKNPAEMAGQRSVFKEGAGKKGKDTDIAMKIFDQVEKFAEYGFNKSHSAAYALVAWWTLWLKTHYPAEFLAAMMTADRQRVEKLVSYIAECNRLKIKVNPPDVTEGLFNFTVNDAGEIIYGIGAVKGIGEDVVEDIIKERAQKPFKDFFDFVKRVGPKHLNRRTFEALVASGALDKLGPSRAQMMASIPTAMKYAVQESSDAASGQLDLFAAISETTAPTFAACRPWSEKYRLYLEKNVLGLYLSGHPINIYIDELTRNYRSTISTLRPGTAQRPNPVTFYGIVISSTERTSKNDGSKFYILILDDGTSQLEFSLYGSVAEQYGAILYERAKLQKQKVMQETDPSKTIPSPLVLIVSGMLSLTEDNITRLRVREIKTLESIRRKNAKNLTLRLSEDQLSKNFNELSSALLNNVIAVQNNSMMNTAQRYPIGQTESDECKGCSFNLMLGNTLLRFTNSVNRYDPSDDLLDSLREIAGNNAVSISY